MRKNITRYSYQFALIVFCVALISVRFSSVLSNFIIVLVFLLLLLGTNLYRGFSNQISAKNQIQLLCIFGIFAVFWVSSLIANIKTKTLYNVNIAFLGAFTLTYISLFWILQLVKNKNYIFFVIKNKINKKYIFTICIIFTILYLDCFFSLFKSDSNTYFLSIVKNYGNWNFELNSLECFQMGGHLAYGYALFAFIGNNLIPKYGIGIRLINLLIYIATLFCMSDLMEKNVKNKLALFYFFSLTVFAFNPLVIGIAQELDLDMSVMCFFVWLIWAFSNRLSIFCIFFSLLLCFSKEIGIVILAGFWIGVYISRYLKNNKSFSIKKLFSNLNIYEWWNVYPAVLFIICMFVLSSQWGAKNVQVEKQIGLVNSFQINPEYIVIKLQHLFIFNFQWLIIPLAILLVIKSINKKAKLTKISEVYYGAIVAYMFFLAFQLLYFTYPHYRYIKLNAVYYALAIELLLDKIFTKERIKYLLAVTISILFLVQSYWMIDPISNNIFRKVSTGNGSITSLAYYIDKPNCPYILYSEKGGANLENEIFRDYVQNNRQYLGFEKCFERLMKKIDYTKNDGLILSPIYSDPYWGDEGWTIVNMFGTYDKTLLHWNNTLRQITYDENDIELNFNDLNYYQINHSQYKKIWYIELPFYKENEEVEKFINSLKGVEKITCEYYGWEINAYLIPNEYWG